MLRHHRRQELLGVDAIRLVPKRLKVLDQTPLGRLGEAPVSREGSDIVERLALPALMRVI